MGFFQFWIILVSFSLCASVFASERPLVMQDLSACDSADRSSMEEHLQAQFDLGGVVSYSDSPSICIFTFVDRTQTTPVSGSQLKTVTGSCLWSMDDLHGEATRSAVKDLLLLGNSLRSVTPATTAGQCHYFFVGPQD